MSDYRSSLVVCDVLYTMESCTEYRYTFLILHFQIAFTFNLSASLYLIVTIQVWLLTVETSHTDNLVINILNFLIAVLIQKMNELMVQTEFSKKKRPFQLKFENIMNFLFKNYSFLLQFSISVRHDISHHLISIFRIMIFCMAIQLRCPKLLNVN